jgi:hypothetical protein
LKAILIVICFLAEKKRIVDAGGSVAFGRVNGGLALSRAIGDFSYKKNPKIPLEEQGVIGIFKGIN